MLGGLMNLGSRKVCCCLTAAIRPRSLSALLLKKGFHYVNAGRLKHLTICLNPTNHLTHTSLPMRMKCLRKQVQTKTEVSAQVKQ